MKPTVPIMSIRLIAPFAAALAFQAGCSATINQDGLEQRTARAIGRSVGPFAITDRSEEAADRINYTSTRAAGPLAAASWSGPLASRRS